MKKQELYNHILGSLVGFAIGDAMGATTEFMSQRDIQRQYGEVNDIIGEGWLNLKPGEVTDDTQMMLIVGKARMRGKEGFAKRCCTGFVQWLEGRPKDVGGACKAAIQGGGSKSPDEWMLLSMDRQTRNHSLDLGNGAVMRCLPLALLGEPNWAVQQGRLTHNNPTSDMYIRDYCWAVSEALRQTSPNLEGFSFEELPLEPMTPTGHVENSVKNAIYWSTQARNFREAILGPVNHGGDADTIAALAGGIAGAYFGVDNIPDQWKRKLDRRTMEGLKRLADWITSELSY